MKTLRFDLTDVLAGALFILLGLFFGVQALGMQIGTALRMGPGYFPLVLSALLILLGAVVALRAIRVEGEPIGPMAFRGILFILPAPIFFGLTLRGLGFVPALFLATLIAAFASLKMRPLPALLLAVSVTAFSVFVFIHGLGLPFRQIGPWLRF